MSIITVLVHAGGEPVDPERLRAMNAAALLLTHARTGQVVRGRAGLAARHVASTPEAVRERQPVANPAGTCWIVMDGRVDNRDELAAGLAGSGAPPAGASDAALVLAAYERWGLDCAPRVIGDFAWAIWDEPRGRLFCARDVMGVRPFFYSWRGGLLACGSQLDPVAAVAGIRPEALSPRFVADFFVAGKSTPDATPWEDARVLPAGNRLVLEGGALKVEPYWDLRDLPQIQYRDHAEYVDHFRELFTTAVRAHLRAPGAVWSDLSGGLDSSSVASVAGRELGVDGAVPEDRLATLSLVFDEAKASDERQWARHVTDRWGIRNHQVVGERFPVFHQVVEGARYWDMPSMEVFSYGFHREAARLLNAHGASALLKGIGAEYVALSEAPSPFHLADLLQAGRLGRMVREAQAWHGPQREPVPFMLWRYGVRPLLFPRTITVRPHTGAPAWAAADFARDTGLHGRAEHAWVPRRFHRVTDQWLYEQVRRLPGSLHPGVLHKAADVRYPFLYRPLVEFSMRIPWEHRIQAGTSKRLLREAMVGILPEPVRTRTRLVTGNAAMYQGLRRAWDTLRDLSEGSWLEELGFVNGPALRDALSLARHGASPFLPGTLRPLALEAWLRGRLGEAPGMRRAA